MGRENEENWEEESDFFKVCPNCGADDICEIPEICAWCGYPLRNEGKIVAELRKFIGLAIPWKVDYGDGYGYGRLDIFVADSIEYNYDESGEWVLVNYEETRWMNLATAKKWSKE